MTTIARSFRSFLAAVSTALLLVTALALIANPTNGFAEDQHARKAKTKVYSVYPPLARQMALIGTVRVLAVVAPNGTVKETKVIGGHPILAAAAVDAVKKWKFDPASAETTEPLEFNFEPGN